MENKNRKVRLGKRARSILIVGITIVLAYVLLQNFSAITTFIGGIFTLISPFLWGIALAYLLSLMMYWLERKVFKKIERKRLKRALSLTLTFVIAISIVVGFFFAVIPQLVSSISTLVTNISGYLDNSEESVMGWAEKIGISRTTIHAIFGSWEEIITTVTDWVKTLIPGILDAGIKVGSGIFRMGISIFVAIYVLIDIERLKRQVKIVSLALFGEKRYEKLDYVRMKCHKAFGGFLVGKIIDSTIIGVICFIWMTIFKWPYAPLISVIVGITNIIPTFGPFIGAIPSIFIIFIVDPLTALWFGIFILVLQQIDGNIIGPYILGDTLGLSALWILFSVVTFGSLWGLTGMLIGVPLFAVVYDLFGEFVFKRLRKKGIDPDSLRAVEEPPTTSAEME